MDGGELGAAALRGRRGFCVLALVLLAHTTSTRPPSGYTEAGCDCLRTSPSGCSSTTAPVAGPSVRPPFAPLLSRVVVQIARSSRWAAATSAMPTILPTDRRFFWHLAGRRSALPFPTQLYNFATFNSATISTCLSASRPTCPFSNLSNTPRSSAAPPGTAPVSRPQPS